MLVCMDIQKKVAERYGEQVFCFIFFYDFIYCPVVVNTSVSAKEIIAIKNNSILSQFCSINFKAFRITIASIISVELFLKKMFFVCLQNIYIIITII